MCTKDMFCGNQRDTARPIRAYKVVKKTDKGSFLSMLLPLN